MPTESAKPSASAPAELVSFTLRGQVVSRSRTLPHVLYLTESYVVTDFEHCLILHCPGLGGRFLVDRQNRLLRRITGPKPGEQIEHLKSLVGPVTIERDRQTIEVNGFSCHRYRLRNSDPRITIRAEALCTRVAGAERSALQDERMLSADQNPLSLPLAPDEIVVHSTTHTATVGYEEDRSYDLVSLAGRIEDRAALDRYLRYPVTDR